MDRKLKNCSKPSAEINNPCIKSTMEKLYEKRGISGDIKFKINSEEIRAHRCVLAALSPKYEAQFYGSMAEEDTINVEDVSLAAFSEFLQFFYADKVTLTLENIEAVLNLAKQSLVDELVIECTNFLIDVVGIDRLSWCYRLAIDYDLKLLEEFCVKHIGVNIKNVFESADFLICERDMLCHILNLDAMNCNETDVLEACVSWAQSKCEADGIDATDTTNMRAALGDALIKVRFCSMKVEEFADINQKYSGLLVAQEVDDVYNTILLKANGTQSSIFGDNNSKMRGLVESKNQECSIAIGPRIPVDAITNVLAITFCPSRAIELKGFVVCERMDENIELVVCPKYPRYLKPKFTTSRTENETKFTLKKPIRIQADDKCMIRVSDRGEQAFSDSYGFRITNRIDLKGFSLIFPSDYTCNKCVNIITHLLFDIVGTA